MCGEGRRGGRKIRSSREQGGNLRGLLDAVSLHSGHGDIRATSDLFGLLPFQLLADLLLLSLPLDALLLSLLLCLFSLLKSS